MRSPTELFFEIDRRITTWMARYGIGFLRVSLGVIFLWFGALKFFPNASPAEELASKTFGALSFGVIPPQSASLLLAIWECLIGIGLLVRIFMRVTLLLLFVQMLGTLTPLFLFSHETFVRIPFVPTLEGQYIIKNLVLISAGLVIGATVRGGAVIADPKAAKRAK